MDRVTTAARDTDAIDPDEWEARMAAIDASLDRSQRLTAEIRAALDARLTQAQALPRRDAAGGGQLAKVLPFRPRATGDHNG